MHGIEHEVSDREECEKDKKFMRRKKICFSFIKNSMSFAKKANGMNYVIRFLHIVIYIMSVIHILGKIASLSTMEHCQIIKKYDFAIDAYIYNKGYKIPMIRNAIRHLRKYGKPELPSRIASKKIITVYRFGLEDINEARDRISWTLSQRVAMWFMERYVHRNIGICEYGVGGLCTTFTYQNDGRLHLYQGKIKRDKIIAYTNSRTEFEIMQNRSVHDIIDISPQVIILKP